MNKKSDIKIINEKIKSESAFIDLLVLEIGKVIIGQSKMVERLLIGLLGRGHILLEGVPGLAKTLAINSLSNAIKASFSRIQFTPDLLPSDIVGYSIFDKKDNDFRFIEGPIFKNIVLAVNKMDLVQYGEKRFNEIVNDFEKFSKVSNKAFISPLLEFKIDLNSSFCVLAKLNPSIIKSLINKFSGSFVYTLQSILTSGLSDVPINFEFTIVYFSFLISSDNTAIFASVYPTKRPEKLFKK